MNFDEIVIGNQYWIQEARPDSIKQARVRKILAKFSDSVIVDTSFDWADIIKCDQVLCEYKKFTNVKSWWR